VKRKSVSILTFGCRVNQYESDAMRTRLSAHFDMDSDSPDVILLNACTVTALAEKKARQAARRARRRAPVALIVLIGCLADAVASGLTRFDEADLLVSGFWKPRIDEVVRAALAGTRGCLPQPRESGTVGSLAGHAPERDTERSDGPTNRIRAVLKIQDGCDLSCAYCRPTQVRGPSRSRSVDQVVAEAVRLDQLGFPEVVLTGINLALYAPGIQRLPDLLRGVLDATGIERIRLASINASGLTPQLLELFAGERRLCQHFHVPMQSGDDEVLTRMRRGYTAAAYEEALERVRLTLPKATFGADVIVGFPGESPSAFEGTVHLVERIGYVNLHIFRFSPRPGTEAATMAGRVPEHDKRRRAEALDRIWRSSLDRLLDKRIGTTQHVLAEEHRQGRWLGYTRDYIHVSFESDHQIALGDECLVRITRSLEGALEGVEEHRDNER